MVLSFAASLGKRNPTGGKGGGADVNTVELENKRRWIGRRRKVPGRERMLCPKNLLGMHAKNSAIGVAYENLGERLYTAARCNASDVRGGVGR